MTDTTDTRTVLDVLPTGTWRIDPTGTSGTVHAKKLGLFTIPAALDVTDGQIEIDTDGSVTSAAVTIDAGSYASKNDKRNEHIHSADFLDVDDHPILDFSSDAIEKLGDHHRAPGRVTVQGVDHPVEVTIDDLAIEGDRATFTARATLDRFAIGISALRPVIGRDLRLVFHVAATRQ